MRILYIFQNTSIPVPARLFTKLLYTLVEYLAGAAIWSASDHVDCLWIDLYCFAMSSSHDQIFLLHLISYHLDPLNSFQLFLKDIKWGAYYCKGEGEGLLQQGGYCRKGVIAARGFITIREAHYKYISTKH